MAIESKKTRKSKLDSTDSMENILISESTETNHPEIDNLHIIDDAKQMMTSFQISNIDNAIATSMAEHMTQWQNTIMDTFAIKCSNLIESEIQKKDTKITKVKEKYLTQESVHWKQWQMSTNNQRGITTL